MMQYHTIADELDEIKITVLKNKKGFYGPSIEFTQIKDKEYPQLTLSWDNPDFIFVTFRDFLKRYINRELLENDKKEFKGIWKILSKKVAKELLKMIIKAEKQGWYVK